MAYQDALFQLGMDLTRSSTAQEEDIGETAQVAHSFGSVSQRHVVRKAKEVERSPLTAATGPGSAHVQSAGNHLIIDLVGADSLSDIDHIERTLRRCAVASGGDPLHVHLHRFTPNGGVSGVVVLADSHISFHSWPEEGYAALDVFMRGNKASAQASAQDCVAVLKHAFSPERVVVKSQRRDGTSTASAAAARDREALAIAQGETAVRVSRQRSKARKAA